MSSIAPARDVQSQVPAVEISLSRVGVTGIEKVVRIGDGERAKLFSIVLDCVIDLGPQHKGAHMSRFEEVINDVVGELVLSPMVLRAEELATAIAEELRVRHDALRAEVALEARYPEHKPAPVSQIPTQEIYTLCGRAVAQEHGTRRVVGVSVQGITACPCAQAQIAADARRRLGDDGFSEEEIARIFDAVPVATHNQRGIGTVEIGLPAGWSEAVDAEDLVTIVERSMSSEIYELMKRTDEAAVVEQAHRHPRFVEDCVREMIRGTLERFPGLHDAQFLSARQVNMETIHQHDVVAERYGTIGELRRELSGALTTGPHTTLRAWLERGR
jgi:GTP cyclohydrolase I/GTP cyclohydrolase-4